MAQITLRDYLQEAEDAIRDDRIEDAFTHCRNILAQFPESLDAQRLLGEAYLAQGQLEEAQQSFDWILTNDPENVVAYCNRALICERSLDYDTALDCYQQAYELSHGNSQIRQEFNRLSAETGPQGFMFSRAGLARLYMRGDLLTQAIQEWEMVLAINPERLDARTGLLETCWREVQYERVEQLATQILQDVPGCLKALYLLAYVNSARNVQQAQDLLRRAESLDPDLLMAQELFSDMMARQPAEPFLQLLKKAPVIVEIAQPQPSVTLNRDQEEAFVQPTQIPAATMSSEALAAWNSLGTGAAANWSSASTLIDGAPETSQVAEPSPAPAWVADPNPSLDIWSVLEGPQGSASLQELQNISAQLQGHASEGNPLNYSQTIEPLETASQQEEPSEAWSPEPALNGAVEDSQNEAENSPWQSPRPYEDLQEHNSQGVGTWENSSSSTGDSGIWGNSSSSTGDSGIWGNLPKEGVMPSPPAWLNMLTQSEIQQLNDGDVSEPSPVDEAPVATPPTYEKAPVVTLKPGIDEEEEAFSFGPEWLKSLGAASIENENSSTEASSGLSSVSSEVAEPEKPVAQTYESQPVAYEVVADEQQPSLPFSENVVDPLDGTVEYDVLTTLEELEADLRTQGFVPLEPNTLQTIAKTQEVSSPSVPKTPELAIPQKDVYQDEPPPSALVELGRFAQGPEGSSLGAFPSAASDQMVPDTSVEEPAWLTSLNAVPTPYSVAEKQQEILANQEEQIYSTLPPLQSSWAGTYMPHEEVMQEETMQPQEVHSVQPTQPLSRMSSWSQKKEPKQEEDRASDQKSEGAQPGWSSMNRPQEALAAQPSTQGVRSATGATARQSSPFANDSLLNNELETTMKRPAMRLQAMEQDYPFVQNDRAPLSPRSRMAEPTSYSGRDAESTVSYQERLLKGYQHQLVGDYDEAMQEYRIIIRNSPELLSEVVSNVRALLKLAPKYSTGYRVLGDAYMRQGEYLQAMEAYNKALTMAKRSKS